jgi:hypothetical protein
MADTVGQLLSIILKEQAFVNSSIFRTNFTFARLEFDQFQRCKKQQSRLHSSSSDPSYTETNWTLNH